MRVYVDGSGRYSSDKEFAYTNESGDCEWVSLFGGEFGIIQINTDDGIDESAAIYIQDIPKLIKALEAAYKEWGPENV
jgi:hypothetical protein